MSEVPPIALSAVSATISVPSNNNNSTRESPRTMMSAGLVSPMHSPSTFGPPRFSSIFDDISLVAPESKRGPRPIVNPKTKIICTIGPSSKSKAVMKDLMNAGMNVIRLNFSHGEQKEHLEVINMAREVMNQTRRLCAIMLDTKGPEIRTGIVRDHKEILLKKGAEFTLVTDETVIGDETQVAVQYANLPKVVKAGNIVLIDDGLISLEVLSTTETSVSCRVQNEGYLGSRKGVNLPNVVVDLPAVTQKDVSDLKFAVAHRLDFIAASFVRKPDDILKIREVLGAQGAGIKIIAKIENQEGLDNFDHILEVADGIMVARGDLGVEIPIEQVSLAQKMMIRKCNAAGKPVITATQMLESMIKNPTPTRAEASDVANAVFDGTDCVMLSGETAKGKYPVEAVKVMADICREAEAATDYREAFHVARQQAFGHCSIPEAIASSAVKACFELKAAVCVVLTETGRTSLLLAKYRPPCPILTLTADERIARQSLVSKGLFPLLVGSMVGTESLIDRAITAARRLGMADAGDMAVITAGMVEGVAGSTNMLKIQQIV